MQKLEYMILPIIGATLSIGCFLCIKLERYYKEQFNQTLVNGIYTLDNDELTSLIQHPGNNYNTTDFKTDTCMTFQDTLYYKTDLNEKIYIDNEKMFDQDIQLSILDINSNIVHDDNGWSIV